jgi:hypothetical protein
MSSKTIPESVLKLEDDGKKTIANAATTSGDEAKKKQKGNKVKKGKVGHGIKKQD